MEDCKKRLKFSDFELRDNFQIIIIIIITEFFITNVLAQQPCCQLHMWYRNATENALHNNSQT
jgi:hypothetical protein